VTALSFGMISASGLVGDTTLATNDVTSIWGAWSAFAARRAWLRMKFPTAWIVWYAASADSPLSTATSKNGPSAPKSSAEPPAC